MERCKTCKHWSRYSQSLDTFGRPAQGFCTLATNVDGRPDHRDSLAVAHDNYRDYAYLNTTETFGCVQWQEKD